MATAVARVLKNTGWLYAKMGITMFISLYTTRLILNGLGASDFGIYNIIGGAIAMLGFLNAAMASATQRFMSYAEGEGNIDKVKYIFNISIILHFGIAIIVGIALALAGFFFFNGILVIPEDRSFAAIVVYLSLIVSTMFTVMSVPYDAVLNANENMRYYAFVGILESILKLLVAFACIYSTYDKLVIYGILMSCIPLVSLSIMRIYCHKKYEECEFSPRRYYSRNLMLEMANFAGWNFLVSITTMITQYGMGIILNHYFGVLLNAALGIANQLSGMLQTLTLNAQKAVNPILMKSAGAGNRQYFSYITLTSSRLSFFLFGLAAIPSIFLMQDLLEIWLKTIPVWGIVFCQMQLLRLLLEEPLVALRAAINAEGKIKGYCISRSIAFSLPLILIPLIFHFGGKPYWLYIVWTICWAFIEGIISMYYLKHKVFISYFSLIRTVLLPCFLTGGISCLPYLFIISAQTSLLARLSLAMLQISLYIILSYYLLLSKDERGLFIQYFKNKFNLSITV